MVVPALEVGDAVEWRLGTCRSGWGRIVEISGDVFTIRSGRQQLRVRRSNICYVPTPRQIREKAAELRAIRHPATEGQMIAQEGPATLKYGMWGGREYDHGAKEGPHYIMLRYDQAKRNSLPVQITKCASCWSESYYERMVRIGGELYTDDPGEAASGRGLVAAKGPRNRGDSRECCHEVGLGDQGVEVAEYSSGRCG